jgi:hypothetical protein
MRGPWVLGSQPLDEPRRTDSEPRKVGGLGANRPFFGIAEEDDRAKGFERGGVACLSAFVEDGGLLVPFGGQGSPKGVERRPRCLPSSPMCAFARAHRRLEEGDRALAAGKGSRNALRAKRLEQDLSCRQYGHSDQGGGDEPERDSFRQASRWGLGCLHPGKNGPALSRRLVLQLG